MTTPGERGLLGRAGPVFVSGLFGWTQKSRLEPPNLRRAVLGGVTELLCDGKELVRQRRGEGSGPARKGSGHTGPGACQALEFALLDERHLRPVSGMGWRLGWLLSLQHLLPSTALASPPMLCRPSQIL